MVSHYPAARRRLPRPQLTAPYALRPPATTRYFEAATGLYFDPVQQVYGFLDHDSRAFQLHSVSQAAAEAQAAVPCALRAV